MQITICNFAIFWKYLVWVILFNSAIYGKVNMSTDFFLLNRVYMILFAVFFYKNICSVFLNFWQYTVLHIDILWKNTVRLFLFYQFIFFYKEKKKVRLSSPFWCPGDIQDMKSKLMKSLGSMSASYPNHSGSCLGNVPPCARTHRERLM